MPALQLDKVLEHAHRVVAGRVVNEQLVGGGAHVREAHHRVHASGVPWNDPSGDRLRDWTGLEKKAFYNPAKTALVPMGFCYPGKGSNGDLPPRPECAPLWHERILSLLPADRLTLLVGSYAQACYLPKATNLSLTERVQAFASFGASVIPLPHPSWRSAIWMKRNPWFESDVLPALREAVRLHL